MVRLSKQCLYPRSWTLSRALPITAVLVTLLPEKVKYIMIRYRFGNAMGDNREEAYLHYPLSKMAILLKRLPNGADMFTSVYLYK